MDNDSRWMDGLSLIFSLVVVVLSAGWLLSHGTFSSLSPHDSQLAWYMIRASGITAYILVTLSVIWGIALGSSAIKNWSPGPLTMLLHATIAWLGLIFGMLHGLLLMFDGYFHYHLTDILIPFTGPYRPLATGLGVLGFWVLVVVTPSFALKKRLFSHRAWKTLHYTSYAAFLLVTLHGLSAGTDATNLGFRLLFGTSVLITLVLLGYRIATRRSPGKKAGAHSAPRPRPAAKLPSGELP
jgi:methionine sulfoxide reductase heme-binding subunit